MTYFTDDNFQLSTNFSPSFDQKKAIDQLSEGLAQNQQHQILLGVTGSGKTFTMANVIAKTQRPAIILAHNKTLAAQLYEEFKTFFPHNAVEYFISYYDYYQPEAYVASSNTFIEKDALVNAYMEQMRLSATKSLLQYKHTIIIASVSAIYGLGSPSTYLDMSIALSLNVSIHPSDIIRQLIHMQYRRNDTYLERANFRVRGELIDVFPAESEFYALRIIFFDDIVETLQLFDPLTGEIIESLESYTLFPKNHYVTPKDKVAQAMEHIKVELKEQIQRFQSEKKYIEEQRIKERTSYDLEMMKELGYCQGIENYSLYLSDRESGSPPSTLFDYLQDNAILFIDESHVTVPQINAMYKGDRSRKENLVNYGFRLPSALDNRPLKFHEWESLSPPTIFVSATPANYEIELSTNTVEQIIRPTGLLDPVIEIHPATHQVDHLYQVIQETKEKNEKILVTTLTKKMAEDLTNYLHQLNVKVRYMHSDTDIMERIEIIRDLRSDVFDVLIGINLLREGLDIPEVSVVAILDADKEGFLRSKTALIQTIGRAARNVNGKAILYADKITRSIQETLDITEDRRQQQMEHNKLFNITPHSVSRKIMNLSEDIQANKKDNDTNTSNLSKVSETKKDYEFDEPLPQTIKKLEKKMKQYAKNYEFEEAIETRELIRSLKQKMISTKSS